MICRTLRLQQGPRILGFARQQCAGIWPNSDGNLSSVVLKQKSPFSKNNNLFQHKKYYSSQDKKMPPIKVLNVAEKNDAAKNIAELLSRGRSQRVIFFNITVLEDIFFTKIIYSEIIFSFSNRKKVFQSSIKYTNFNVK